MIHRFAFAGLTLCLIAGAAAATCAVRARVVAPVYSAAVYAAPVVAEKVVEKVVVPVATYVPVPVYAAVYTPPAHPPMPPAELRRDDLRQILEALQALDGRLKALERPSAPAHPEPAPEPAPAPAPPGKVDPFLPKPKKTGALEAPRAPSALAVFQVRCAGCHEAKTSADKGGGFTLLQGERLVALTDRQARKVATMSYTGKMPPKKTGITLTDQEVSLIVDFIDTTSK